MQVVSTLTHSFSNAILTTNKLLIQHVCFSNLLLLYGAFMFGSILEFYGANIGIPFLVENGIRIFNVSSKHNGFRWYSQYHTRKASLSK